MDGKKTKPPFPPLKKKEEGSAYHNRHVKAESIGRMFLAVRRFLTPLEESLLHLKECNAAIIGVIRYAVFRLLFGFSANQTKEQKKGSNALTCLNL